MTEFGSVEGVFCFLAEHLWKETLMKISPTLETVKEIAAGSQFKVLPVSCEILSDICTPMEALNMIYDLHLRAKLR